MYVLRFKDKRNVNTVYFIIFFTNICGEEMAGLRALWC